MRSEAFVHINEKIFSVLTRLWNNKFARKLSSRSSFTFQLPEDEQQREGQRVRSCMVWKSFVMSCDDDLEQVRLKVVKRRIFEFWDVKLGMKMIAEELKKTILTHPNTEACLVSVLLSVLRRFLVNQSSLCWVFTANSSAAFSSTRTFHYEVITNPSSVFPRLPVWFTLHPLASPLIRSIALQCQRKL